MVLDETRHIGWLLWFAHTPQWLQKGLLLLLLGNHEGRLLLLLTFLKVIFNWLRCPLLFIGSVDASNGKTARSTIGTWFIRAPVIIIVVRESFTDLMFFLIQGLLLYLLPEVLQVFLYFRIHSEVDSNFWIYNYRFNISIIYKLAYVYLLNLLISLFTVRADLYINWFK